MNESFATGTNFKRHQKRRYLGTLPLMWAVSVNEQEIVEYLCYKGLFL